LKRFGELEHTKDDVARIETVPQRGRSFIQAAKHLVDRVEREPALSQKGLRLGLAVARVERLPAREPRRQGGASDLGLVALTFTEHFVDEARVDAFGAQLALERDRPFGTETGPLVEPVFGESSIIDVPLLAQALDRERDLLLVVTPFRQVTTQL